MIFTAWHLNASRPLTVKQRNRLLKLLDLYAIHKNGAWLRNVNYRAIEFRWCDAMLDEPAGPAAELDGDGAILGAYHVANNSVYLQPLNEEHLALDPLAWVEILFPTVVHELRHAWQRRTFGFLAYAIASFPLIREITIEMDAWRQTNLAEEYQNEEA